jgi:hypothetical protein
MKETDSNWSEYEWLSWLQTSVVLEILEISAHLKTFTHTIQNKKIARFVEKEGSRKN